MSGFMSPYTFQKIDIFDAINYLNICLPVVIAISDNNSNYTGNKTTVTEKLKKKFK